MTDAAKRSGEFAWIERHFAPLAGQGAYGLKDDAATLAAPAGYEFVVTQDTLVEGVHFFADDEPAKIAMKAMRVNVSDIVAKGAAPHSFMLSIAVPKVWTDGQMDEFASGIAAEAQHYEIGLLGGDTTTSPHGLIVTVTLFGLVKLGKSVTRLTAQPGDSLVLLGPVGDAALGLGLRLGEMQTNASLAAQTLMDRQVVPDRFDGVQNIVAAYGRAAMDVSDGLIGDLRKLCVASEAGANILLDDMPVSDAAADAFDINDEQIVLRMATGGDDYVVLMTVDPDQLNAVHSAAMEAGLVATRVGEITSFHGDEAARLGILFRGNTVSVNDESYSHR